MKKLLLILLSVLSMSVVTLAKDGPFPIESVVGVWKSENVPGLQVRITLGQRTATAVVVYVLLVNNKGEVMASGAATHRLADHDLVVSMIDKHEQSMTVVVKVLDDNELGKSSKTGYHLVFSITHGLQRPTTSNLVFGRP